LKRGLSPLVFWMTTETPLVLSGETGGPALGTGTDGSLPCRPAEAGRGVEAPWRKCHERSDFTGARGDQRPP
jgi:hypothetical protein